MKDQFTKSIRIIDPEFRHKGLRIGTLWFSPIQGTGDVTLSPFYLQGLDFVTQIDVIRDCEGLLSQHADKLILNAREITEQKQKLRRLKA